ncbi:CBS domain-containing protein [Nitrospira tepida]|uniref:CBS domain-containing protein n=1 Tax=Nitrospira tepida TaxID=2973512 RepID=A0AA86MYG5_9BACT|nr:CBS domain-containing protein [Nitrospira tepida]CAI4031365.1 CBS domain-containing protein [Nitrospira tepida]
MINETTPGSSRTASLDRSIDRLRQHLAQLVPLIAEWKDHQDKVLDDFDSKAEQLIREALGDTSRMVEAYEYAQLGAAAGLVNFPDEAPEGGETTRDHKRESLNQRKRVLESCIAELEADRAAVVAQSGHDVEAVIGPHVAHHMTSELRSVHVNASLKEAGRLMQQWAVGSLLVTDDKAFVGLVTDSDLAREVVAKGLDPAITKVKACMRSPIPAIEGDRPIIEAVRMMKDRATRHLAVTDRGEITGLISVSNILRYYSGVV